MRFRCPYCGQITGEKAAPRCPHCRKVMILPDNLRDRTFQQRRQDRLRIEREGEHKRRAMLARGVPFSRPGTPLILMAMLAVAGVLLVGRTRRATPARTKPDPREMAQHELDVLRIAAEQFRQDCGRYPRAPEGLEALINNPGASGWRGPYVTLIRRDPWRQPYQYRPAETNAVLLSLGPDGREGTADDLAAAPPSPDDLLR